MPCILNFSCCNVLSNVIIDKFIQSSHNLCEKSTSIYSLYHHTGWIWSTFRRPFWCYCIISYLKGEQTVRIGQREFIDEENDYVGIGEEGASHLTRFIPGLAIAGHKVVRQQILHNHLQRAERIALPVAAIIRDANFYINNNEFWIKLGLPLIILVPNRRQFWEKLHFKKISDQNFVHLY